jgi:cell division protein FtsL
VPLLEPQRGFEMVSAVRFSEIQGKRNAVNGVRIKNSKSRRRLLLSRRQMVLIAGLLVTFMVTGVGYVWLNFEGTQIGYDISKLKQEELRLKELNQKLKLELATLKSPQYLEKSSRHLGLRPATPEQIFVLP